MTKEFGVRALQTAELQERYMLGSRVLYDPARPRFCPFSEAVWEHFSPLANLKIGISLVPTHSVASHHGVLHKVI